MSAPAIKTPRYDWGDWPTLSYVEPPKPYDWRSEPVVVTLQLLALRAQLAKGVIWMTADEYDHYRLCLRGLTFPGMCFGRRIAIVDVFDTMEYIVSKEA